VQNALTSLGFKSSSNRDIRRLRGRMAASLHNSMTSDPLYPFVRPAVTPRSTAAAAA
jgi:hypothetical protein